MKINYFQQGGQYRMTPEEIQRQASINMMGEAGFNRINQLADEVYANFIKNNPIDTSFLKPINREPQINPVNDDIVNQVIRGKFGNGQARIAALTQAGYDPKEVQRAVNAKLKPQATPTPAPTPAAPASPTNTPSQEAPKSPGYADIYGFTPMINFGNTVKQTETTPTTVPAASQPVSTPTAPVTTEPQTNNQFIYDQNKYGNFSRNNFLNAYKQYYNTSNPNPSEWQNAFRQARDAYNKQVDEFAQNSNGKYTSGTPVFGAGVKRLYLQGGIQASNKAIGFNPQFKQGGSINFLQQGGQMQQDPVGQVIQGLLQDPQGTMQALSQMQGQQGGKEQVNAILQEIVKRAKGGDQQAAQAIQVLQQAMQGGQQAAPQQAPAAKNGAKLNYLKQLKGKCPEGEELVYMKKGGLVCPVCQKKKLEEGAKVNKTEFFKKDTKKPLDKCGGKMKAKKK